MTANSVNSFACYIYISAFVVRLQLSIDWLHVECSFGTMAMHFSLKLVVQVKRYKLREETLQLCKVERERELCLKKLFIQVEFSGVIA